MDFGGSSSAILLLSSYLIENTVDHLPEIRPSKRFYRVKMNEMINGI
jgi:hypothetical protein